MKSAVRTVYRYRTAGESRTGFEGVQEKLPETKKILFFKSKYLVDKLRERMMNVEPRINSFQDLAGEF